MKRALTILTLLCAAALTVCAKPGYTVTAGGRKVKVYEMKVSPADSLSRMRGMDDKQGSASIYEMAAYRAAIASRRDGGSP